MQTCDLQSRRRVIRSVLSDASSRITTDYETKLLRITVDLRRTRLLSVGFVCASVLRAARSAIITREIGCRTSAFDGMRKIVRGLAVKLHGQKHERFCCPRDA